MDDLKAKYLNYTLRFKQPSGTSRGVLTTKESWLVLLSFKGKNLTGVGECSLIKGLSPDDNPGFEHRLATCCKEVSETGKVNLDELNDYPAIRFGLETALLDLKTGGKKILFPSAFTQGNQSISINGLIWMGDVGFMKQQVREKIAAGYHCLKLKIGAIDFEQELDLLKKIRQEFPLADLELRVDANGAFSPEIALEKLKRLSALDLHSIEQPILPGQIETMARLCQESPLDIALDEELIGVSDPGAQKKLLDLIKPRYIILKPSLVGGLEKAGAWIDLAKERNIGWWMTSALESNIGLNAIAQWTHTLKNPMPQGLGTGQLYTNNIASPLYIKKGRLYHKPDMKWDKDNLLG